MGKKKKKKDPVEEYFNQFKSKTPAPPVDPQGSGLEKAALQAAKKKYEKDLKAYNKYIASKSGGVNTAEYRKLQKELSKVKAINQELTNIGSLADDALLEYQPKAGKKIKFENEMDKIKTVSKLIYESRLNRPAPGKIGSYQTRSSDELRARVEAIAGPGGAKFLMTPGNKFQGGVVTKTQGVTPPTLRIKPGASDQFEEVDLSYDPYGLQQMEDTERAFQQLSIGDIKLRDEALAYINAPASPNKLTGSTKSMQIQKSSALKSL